VPDTVWRGVLAAEAAIPALKGLADSLDQDAPAWKTW
jgi:hypothetical protein